MSGQEPHPSANAQRELRGSTASREYDVPETFRNLDDSLPPVSLPLPQDASTLPHGQPRRSRSRSRPASTASQANYDVPDSYANLDETAAVSPVQNPYEEPIFRFQSLEQVRSREQGYIREQERQRRQSLAEGRPPEPEKAGEAKRGVSRLLTQFYTVSYLTFFSILGTLARLGLQALTNYPGTPIIFPSIWPNFVGCLIMGYLSEDRMLFSEADDQSPPPLPPTHDSDEDAAAAIAAAKKAHAALKKTIPLYIGLATGFCGSLTSFSAFIRDTFLALSNDLPASAADPAPRNDGYSVLAILAVPLTTLSLSLTGLFLGAHLAIALAPFTPPLPRALLGPADRLVALLAWPAWLGAALLAAFPPAGHADWRGKAVFALVFAPLGCLARFYASLRLNGRVAAFPLGTFAVNVVGTGVLAMAWDLAHSGADGFCGCLTTVSTWVAELASLRRRHAYVYGGASVLVGLAVAVAVMGGLRWSGGFERAACG
ncbi:1bbff36b-2d54-4937-a164-057b9573b449 [Thermothielavioides terrestris]|uniref:1bbff36b-2d54-4937-a164-057b9573b449 n=1 Tax=Thermothielavioides terrestris TaxID=2587410 RepID=A0A446BJE1_9PEZI|nr:1bbff36b-2d54-4937-a164-057b9573b449 [Thermothielavioides terrestris]